MPDSILVIDDDEFIRDFIVRLLRKEGYDVAESTNGQEGLAYLRQARELPNLILLDLAMPVMNGWQFRQNQLQEQRLAEIPVVLLSASHELERGASTLHIPEYLAKPITAEQLLDVAARYCAVES